MTNEKNYHHFTDVSTMDTPYFSAELFSVLADGQATATDVSVVMAACAQDPELMHSWNIYHLIGEVLRTPSLPVDRTVAINSAADFSSRVQQRLLLEPLPGKSPMQLNKPELMPDFNGKPAANDSSFRWKMVAGVASLAAVSAIAWNTVARLTESSAPQLAQTMAPQLVVASPQGPMVRDARLEELLAAHGKLGSASALQESSGFLRNATFESGQEVRSGTGR